MGIMDPLRIHVNHIQLTYNLLFSRGLGLKNSLNMSLRPMSDFPWAVACIDGRPFPLISWPQWLFFNPELSYCWQIDVLLVQHNRGRNASLQKPSVVLREMQTATQRQDSALCPGSSSNSHAVASDPQGPSRSSHSTMSSSTRTLLSIALCPAVLPFECSVFSFKVQLSFPFSVSPSSVSPFAVRSPFLWTPMVS